MNKTTIYVLNFKFIKSNEALPAKAGEMIKEYFMSDDMRKKRTKEIENHSAILGLKVVFTENELEAE